MKNAALGIFSALALVLVFAAASAAAGPDVDKHPSCAYCGMDRAKFAHSRVYLEYDDGSTFGACSLHCAAVDMAVHIDKAPVSIQVGDFGAKKLVNAESAAWVIGGGKPGVMTARAKWAFETKTAAEAFVKENGGTLAGFEEAVKAAYEDMYQDTKMIRDRRKAKRMQQPKQ